DPADVIEGDDRLVHGLVPVHDDGRVAVPTAAADRDRPAEPAAAEAAIAVRRGAGLRRVDAGHDLLTFGQAALDLGCGVRDEADLDRLGDWGSIDTQGQDGVVASRPAQGRGRD